MQKQKIIQAVCDHFEALFSDEATGHDWYHIERVWKNAKRIQATEGGDLFVIELGALLHDIADHKFVENADVEAEKRSRTLLSALGVDAVTQDAVLHIVQNCSFKGGIGENKMKSLEGKIVQDADRLDAIGAIGIARTFAYGGSAGNVIYDPKVKPSSFKTAEQYRTKRTHTINHFYEKLLNLKEGMNTKTGATFAGERDVYMRAFLEQFYAEWDGSR